jgi:hypothetical protein
MKSEHVQSQPYSTFTTLTLLRIEGNFSYFYCLVEADYLGSQRLIGHFESYSTADKVMQEMLEV